MNNQYPCQTNISNGNTTKTLTSKKIWTIDDVSQFTGFKRSTIYNKVHKDEIPYKKRGGKLYFIGFEIQNWMFEGD